MSHGEGPPRTHDYTAPEWGHNCLFEPVDEGKQGKAIGWGTGIRRGDYLILTNRPGSTRYRVEAVEYFGDPPDMWRAELAFFPRNDVNP